MQICEDSILDSSLVSCGMLDKELFGEFLPVDDISDTLTNSTCSCVCFLSENDSEQATTPDQTSVTQTDHDTQEGTSRRKRLSSERKLSDGQSCCDDDSGHSIESTVTCELSKRRKRGSKAVLYPSCHSEQQFCKSHEETDALIDEDSSVSNPKAADPKLMDTCCVEKTQYPDENTSPVAKQQVDESLLGDGWTFGREQSIMFFDWDDTLLPSTWLSSHKLTLEEECVVPSQMKAILKEMAESSRQTLETASALGTVVIVTNAEQGWIELSCAKFMPSLAPHLVKYRQLSARSVYETTERASPFAWKQLAFRNEIINHCQPMSKCLTKNFLSFGDSTHERLALLMITRTLPTDEDGCCRLDATVTITDCAPSEDLKEIVGPFRSKSVKFMERPHIEDLKKEHTLISSLLRQISQRDSDLDLIIQPADIQAQPNPVPKSTNIRPQAAASAKGAFPPREQPSRNSRTPRGSVKLPKDPHRLKSRQSVLSSKDSYRRELWTNSRRKYVVPPAAPPSSVPFSAPGFRKSVQSSFAQEGGLSHPQEVSSSKEMNSMKNGSNPQEMLFQPNCIKS